MVPADEDALSRRAHQEILMQIKTNVRAGKGGASGAGKNSKGSGSEAAEAPVYVPPVSRCAGI
jgi:hypothetical protein